MGFSDIFSMLFMYQLYAHHRVRRIVPVSGAISRPVNMQLRTLLITIQFSFLFFKPGLKWLKSIYVPASRLSNN